MAFRQLALSFLRCCAPTSSRHPLKNPPNRPSVAKGAACMSIRGFPDFTVGEMDALRLGAFIGIVATLLVQITWAVITALS